MISMLKGWKGPVEVNNTQFDNITAAISVNKTISGPICIKLYPEGFKGQVEEDSTDTKQDIKQVYKITVKQYMTKPSEPGFDFMAKWNNDNPMPLRTMVGTVEKETRGMYKMKLKGMAEKTCTCMRCDKTLTNPISKLYGIGPECITKIGFDIDINDVDTITQKLEEVEWEGWIIKSGIIEMEEINA